MSGKTKIDQAEKLLTAAYQLKSEEIPEISPEWKRELLSNLRNEVSNNNHGERDFEKFVWRIAFGALAASLIMVFTYCYYYSTISSNESIETFITEMENEVVVNYDVFSTENGDQT